MGAEQSTPEHPAALRPRDPNEIHGMKFQSYQALNCCVSLTVNCIAITVAFLVGQIHYSGTEIDWGRLFEAAALTAAAALSAYLLAYLLTKCVFGRGYLPMGMEDTESGFRRNARSFNKLLEPTEALKGHNFVEAAPDTAQS